MRKWLTILSMLLVTTLLLLSSLDRTEGNDEESKSFGSVAGILDHGFTAQSDKGNKIGKKMGTVGQVICSIRTSPDQMVLMFQHLNSTQEELAADCSEVRIRGPGDDEKGIEKIHILGSVPIIPDTPQIQLAFYDWHGNVTPTNLNVKTFHAALGGIVITAKRSHLIEFSQPYAELELEMVVKKKHNELKEVLWFMSPFTREMWLIMAAMTVFTGFVIWLIEHRTGNEMPSRQDEAIFFCFPFAFLLNEHRPRNILSFYVLVPWLILILIVTTTFTASLSSMITSSQAEPSDLNVDSLKKTNAAIASDGNSFTVSYLVKVLGFKRKNIRNIASVDDSAKAFSSGNIKAAFLSTPDAKVFLAKYCRAFTKSGPTYNLGNFGFVFPKGSSLASDMSEAILHLKEAGELEQMEEDTISFSNCSTSDIQNVSRGIGPGPFSCLFILSGGASASALLITVIRLLKRRWESCFQRMLMGRGLLVWLIILIFSHNQTTNELQLNM